MDLISLIQDGSTSFPYLAAVGLVLGSLHGLEPGHSKTMMAAFIVAVRGTPFQAVLLGVSAALSHSIVVWAMAVLALTWGDEMIGEKLEPWFIAGSGAIVMAVGLFMLWRALGRVRARRDRRHPHDDDAHVRAHARDIETRFAGGRATAPQTIGFGLVGGLIPCPAAITVLLLCLGIGQFWLGVGMVASFSVGLAATLVAVGMAAVLGLRYASKRFSGADRLLASAPWVSGALILLVGTYMAYSGWSHLAPAAGA
ncbi:MAG: sulfite exporter TauE/SafE family protein [Defluviicoccus sp.]|nr:sulfite exporter TauE/SafE family protein [Defluviicoccus sp.]MDE0278910.1 sulfite exporter TauE/SafE family protein [Defluviicoccus sp.]